MTKTAAWYGWNMLCTPSLAKTFYPQLLSGQQHRAGSTRYLQDLLLATSGSSSFCPKLHCTLSPVPGFLIAFTYQNNPVKLNTIHRY